MHMIATWGPSNPGCVRKPPIRTATVVARSRSIGSWPVQVNGRPLKSSFASRVLTPPQVQGETDAAAASTSSDFQQPCDACEPGYQFTRVADPEAFLKTELPHLLAAGEDNIAPLSFGGHATDADSSEDEVLLVSPDGKRNLVNSSRQRSEMAVETSVPLPDGDSGAVQAHSNGTHPEPGTSRSKDLPPRRPDPSSGFRYEYDEAWVNRQYQTFQLRVLLSREGTGYQAALDVQHLQVGDLIAGRYQVLDFLGSAAFSKGVKAIDIETNQHVCLKIIKNDKSALDQSLYEIKLLSLVLEADPDDDAGVVRLHDYFYYKEHLFLVCELLGTNLYEYLRYMQETKQERYFTPQRCQIIARQVLRSLSFLHGLGLIHSDLKPENILFVSYRRCEVKVIDLGSSRHVSDPLSLYVQSRNYRAPEVILGLPHGQKIDTWSLGCILAELYSGDVLFTNESEPTLLARLESILGAVPHHMVQRGQYAGFFYTRSHRLYRRRELDSGGAVFEVLAPNASSLERHMPGADQAFVDFVRYLLTVDPDKRPSAEEALNHSWLQHEY